MTKLQRQLLFFLCSGLFLAGTFAAFGWKGAIVVLVLLLIFIGAYLKPLYDLVVHPPNRASEDQPSSQEERPSYDQGLREVPYYQPPMPKEAPITEEVPAAQYPEMQQYR